MASDLIGHNNDDAVPNKKPIDTDDSNTDEQKNEVSSAPEDTNQVEDDDAVDDSIEYVKYVTENKYYFVNSVISESAFGSNASVNSQSGKKKQDSDKETQRGKESNLTIDWDDWFRQKQFHEQIFIVALLFFSGNHPRFVENMAIKLIGLYDISDNSDDENPSIFDDKFSIDSLLDDNFATMSRETISTEAGPLDFDAISISNAEALLKIKEILLEDHKSRPLRAKVKTWLKNHIRSNNSHIKTLGSYSPELSRIQAGLGVGLLIRTEHEPLSVINSWAKSENPKERLMVGWFLLGYFEEGSQSVYWSSVSALLGHWSTLINSYYLRWTAIASTTRLGLIVSPDDDSSLVLSLSIYKEVCNSGQVNLFRGKYRGVLLKSLKFLYSLSSYHARTITIELASWLEDDENLRLQDIAAELFVEIVDIKTSIEDDSFDFRNISIWELCEIENYALSEAVYYLIRQALMHQQGTFVDHSVSKLSRSLSRYLDRDTLSGKRVENIFDKLRGDSQTKKYVPLILVDHD